MMRRLILFAAGGFLLLAGAMTRAQKPASIPRQPGLVIPSDEQTPSVAMLTTVSMLRVSPSTIPFTANSPGSTTAGGSVATVAWNVSGGKKHRTWTLSVGTSSSIFSGCKTVPESAVRVMCTSATVTGGGQASAGCNATSFATLPNTLPGLRVASGNEGNTSSHNYSVVLRYEIVDSWRYIANVCPLTVTYTVNAP